MNCTIGDKFLLKQYNFWGKILNIIQTTLMKLYRIW